MIEISIEYMLYYILNYVSIWTKLLFKISSKQFL